MRTLVKLENSNCTRCHNQLVDLLRAREGVEAVWAHFSTGCLVVDHHEDPDALVSLIEHFGRAIEMADNGERVMVALDAHEAADCSVAERAGQGGSASPPRAGSWTSLASKASPRPDPRRSGGASLPGKLVQRDAAPPVTVRVVHRQRRRLARHRVGVGW